MLKIDFSRIFFRKSILFVLLILISFLLLSCLPLEAQASSKENLSAQNAAAKVLAEKLKNNPWANIKEFRSAKFGMNDKGSTGRLPRTLKFQKIW